MTKTKVVADELDRILGEACVEEDKAKYIKDAVVKAIGERLRVITASANVDDEAVIKHPEEVEEAIYEELINAMFVGLKELIVKNKDKCFVKNVNRKDNIFDTQSKYTLTLTLYGD